LQPGQFRSKIRRKSPNEFYNTRQSAPWLSISCIFFDDRLGKKVGGFFEISRQQDINNDKVGPFTLVGGFKSGLVNRPGLPATLGKLKTKATLSAAFAISIS